MAVVRTRHTGSLRVPGQRQTSQGESDPKPRPLRVRGRRRWRAGAKFLHRCTADGEGGTRQEAPATRMDRGGCSVGGTRSRQIRISVSPPPGRETPLTRRKGRGVQVAEKSL